jgi:hypothetical protein
MKFAFNTFPFSSFPTFLPTYSLDDTIRILARIGYDAVEIGCCAPHAWPAHLPKARRAEIKALADGEGVAISSLLPAIGGGFGCNPCSILKDERLATIAHYKDIVELADDLGARMVLFIGGWRAETMSRDEGWAHSLDCLRMVAAHAAERDITIAIEPTTADTNLIDTAADARRMMLETEQANVRLMFGRHRPQGDRQGRYGLGWSSPCSGAGQIPGISHRRDRLWLKVHRSNRSRRKQPGIFERPLHGNCGGSLSEVPMITLELRNAGNAMG